MFPFWRFSILPFLHICFPSGDFLFFHFCTSVPAKMSWHPETNPHFIKTPQRRDGQRSQTPPGPVVSQRQGQQNQPPRNSQATQPRKKGQGSKPKGELVAQAKREHQREGQFPIPYPESHFPLHHEQFHSPQGLPPQHRDQHYQPHYPLLDDQSHSPQEIQPQPQGKHPQPHGPQQHGEIHGPPMDQDQDHGPRATHPQNQERQPWQPYKPGVPPAQGHDSHRRSHGFRVPRSQKTHPLAWLGAVFCAIFWIVIFLGGLIVLIVYLVYRPRSPRFDVASATLNAAYIDTGSLLNADLSMLANFTNPNKKASVDFSYVIIDLYYGSTLIATQYIEPFSAANAQPTFVNVHVVTSQVRLPVMEGQRLQEQMNRNGVIFDVKGVFRVRSKLGRLLQYSYRLYGHCTIMVTAPPNGVLRATKCRTKR